jgi:hypothetical protein
MLQRPHWLDYSRSSLGIHGGDAELGGGTERASNAEPSDGGPAADAGPPTPC